MRWVLIVLAVVVVGLAAAGFFMKDRLFAMAFFASTKMRAPFDEAVAPPAPDYANPDSWASLPEKSDMGDLAPATDPATDDAAVDVFFVHPTTYLKGAYWNAPIDEPSAKGWVDGGVMPGQASVFNGCCRIYAPRYRQAAFGALFAKPVDAKRALDIAYGDVERAFDYFLEHYSKGRPFILASHSQGSFHLERLIEERISGTPLEQRLVAAYPVGGYFNVAEFAKEAPGVPVCQSAEETGCYATWNTLGPAGKPFVSDPGAACVNPLTWKIDGAYAGFDLNLGATTIAGGLEPIPGAADAQCEAGSLRLTKIKTHAYDKLPMTLGKDNYHILDYALYYMNVRENAKRRVAAWLAAHPQSENAAPAN